MSRRQRSTSAPPVRPTYTKILDHAVAVLNEDGFDRFSVQRVLDAAEISRATLYRHFPDVDSLIEAALVEQFRHEVDRTLMLTTELIERSHDRAAFRDGVRTLLHTFGNIPGAVRLQRAHIIALAATRPRLAAAIAEVQDALTSGWASTFEAAQARGLLRADIDTEATAVMIQSMALGRIIDDAGSRPLDSGRWSETFFDFVDRALLRHDA